MPHASQAEREAIYAYQHKSRGLRESIVEKLRSREFTTLNDEEIRMIDLIDGVIERSTSTINGMAYLAFDSATRAFYYHDNAYTCLTLCMQVAWEFCRKAESPKLMEIYLPRGTRAIFLPHVTDTGHAEAQLLLRRSTMLHAYSFHHRPVDGIPILMQEAKVIQYGKMGLDFDWQPPQVK